MRFVNDILVVLGLGVAPIAQSKVIGLGIHRSDGSGRQLQDSHAAKAAPSSHHEVPNYVKYNPGNPLVAPKAVDETNTDKLTSIQSIYYIGPIDVGGQTFQVIYDTGSNLLWVPGSSCTSTCEGKSKYTGNYQSTNEPFALTYGSGSVTGTMVEAPVSFAEANLTSFPVGLASEVGFPGYETSAYEGLLGLAWPSLNDNSSIPSLVPALYSAGEISQNLFSIYLSADGTTGELSLGEIDPTRYSGDIVWMPLILEQWWTVNYVGYAVAGGNVNSVSATPAIIDSGTSLIVGPTDGVTNIIDTIATDNPNLTIYYSAQNQLYAVECTDVDNLPAVTLYMQGADRQRYAFTMPGKSYVVPALSSDPSICPLAFQPSGDMSDMWIMGDPFLRAFYTIYDYENSRVGLAATVPPAGTAVPYGNKAAGQWSTMTAAALVALVMAVAL